MDSTERLSLPLLAPGQAQKELFHNEALLILDAVVAGAVEELPRNDPPAAPAVGASYIVGSAPTGDWSQHASHLAAFTTGGWRFIAPTAGLSVFVKSTETVAAFGTGGWETGALRGNRVIVDGEQVLGARAAAIPDPSGGVTPDAEARTAIAQILAALRQHGLISS